jgi:alpha-amylase/alpha-mannosidase (GH57 family)
MPMKNVFAAIHGHFYQPPRENPWLEAIETEESARPFHDWNERIGLECYHPNAYARIVDGQGKILDIIDNYSSISFNFGPTLLPWIEKKMPSVYQKILDADRESLKRFGHGNAIGQAYNHIILPLANGRDKETEVLWGITDFEKRFRRKPEAIWLPETAVDDVTLRVLAGQGMRYVLLSPFQALRVRSLGGGKWTDVTGGRIDPTQAYRCFIKDDGGKKQPDRFIDLFFYDGLISKEIGFGDLLKDGNAFCDRFVQARQPESKRPQLLHIATDGETYGHHKKFGDMALAFAVTHGLSRREIEIINYGTFLERFQPLFEVEIDPGPKGEGTSWSCAHGVGRWKENCGCSTGGEPGWNQEWRKPLREALNALRDELALVFEREGEPLFHDVWKARNGYIEVILDRSAESLRRFFEKSGKKDLDGEERIRGLKLLEMERHALQMYTSCGWFFNDLAGIETLIVLQHAAMAIELAEELTGREIEKGFADRLSRGRSNVKEMGDGAQIYRDIVKPRKVSPERIVGHAALSSLLDGKEAVKEIYCYRVEKLNEERPAKDGSLRVLGRMRVTSHVIPEPGAFLYAGIATEKDVFRVWVRACGKEEDGGFDLLRSRGLELSGKGEDAVKEGLRALLGDLTFTLRDTLKDERQPILRGLLEKEYRDHCDAYSDLFERTKGIVKVLFREGLEIPYEIRVAAEVALRDRLLKEVEMLKSDFRGTLERGEIGRIVAEESELGLKLKKEEILQVLNQIFHEKMLRVRKGTVSDLSIQPEILGEALTLLQWCERWGFELRKEEAQDWIDEILDDYLPSLEESWWGGGEEKPFLPDLIRLAERLGFNVDRFSKMVV